MEIKPFYKSTMGIIAERLCNDAHCYFWCVKMSAMKYRVREMISLEAEAELTEFPELTRHLLFHRGVRGR